MSDEADIASAIEAETLAVILANRPRTTSGVSASNCEECDVAIPETRRVALPGIQTCVHCAQLIEDSNAFKIGRLR